MDQLQALSAAWIAAKEEERLATAKRREVEDQMVSLIGIAETMEGTTTKEGNGYKIKIVGRINRSVDSGSLQELAAEAGLTEHLSSLFRWKAEINGKAWGNADESITRAFASAITAKPGRPSFTVTQEN